jgi:uncharacterized protein
MIHINANYMDIHGRASDHDPVLIQVDVHKEDTYTLASNKTNFELESGQTAQINLTETTTKYDGSTTTKDVAAEAIYSGFDTNVISVEQGVITAKAEGSTTITAQYGDNSVKFSVNVFATEDGGIVVTEDEIDTTTPVIKVDGVVEHEAGHIGIRFTEAAVNKIDDADKNVSINLATGSFNITSENFDVLAASGEFTLNLEYQVPKGLLKEKNQSKIKDNLKLKDMSFIDAQNNEITAGFNDYFIIVSKGKKTSVEGAYYDNKSKKWKFKNIKNK